MKNFVSVSTSFAIVLSASFWANLVSANDPSVVNDSSVVKNVENVIVSATLTEKDVFNVLGSASLISKADLERIQPLDLAELFESQRSMDVTRNGGRASNTNMFTRGTNNGHTLFMVNGHRFGSATTGSTSFQFVDPEQIERLEIVRGSRSALYGSDAIGGVVNILTTKPVESLEGYITGSTGSHSNHRISGGLSNHHNISLDSSLTYSVAYSKERSDGIDNLVDEIGYNSDDDGFDDENVSVFSDFDINDLWRLSFAHMQLASTSDYDSLSSQNISQPYTDLNQRSSSLSLEGQLSTAWDAKLSLSQSADESFNSDRALTQEDIAQLTDYEQQSLGDSSFDTQRDALFWNNNITLNEALILSLGVDYVDESVDSFNGYQVNRRDNLAMYSQLQYQFKRFDALVGFRQDDNSAYGTVDVGSAALGVTLNGYRIYMSWAEGFKAPSFNDLYYPGSESPDLKPEESESFELGYKVQHASFNYEVTVFTQEIVNLIEWSPSPTVDNPFLWLPLNIGKATIDGVEFWFGTQVANVHIEGSYSYADARDNETNDLLLNRSKQKITLDAYRTFSNVTLGASARYNSERFTSSGQKIPEFALLNMYASFDINKNFMVKLKINNTFAAYYQTKELYREDGRNGTIKFIYNF